MQKPSGLKIKIPGNKNNQSRKRKNIDKPSYPPKRPKQPQKMQDLIKQLERYRRQDTGLSFRYRRRRIFNPYSEVPQSSSRSSSNSPFYLYGIECLLMMNVNLMKIFIEK